ncbi:MAG TPA: amylo-alpha-1,6-glucosidase [Anaerolineae bacterium]
MLEFGRDICGNLALSETREWLVTNGLGGFASGTVAGLLTRRYHGLLLAAVQPPVGRILMVSKLDETITYAGEQVALYVNRWAGGVVEPGGYHYLENFHLEGTVPVWTFAIADALLEKRIWMQQGANTSYVQYYLRRATAPLDFETRVMVNYRNFHHDTHAGDWQMQVEPANQGLKIKPYEGAISFYLLSDQAQATPRHDWYRRFFLMREANRGLNAIEDHLHVADFKAELHPGATLTLVFSTEANPNLNGETAYAEQRAYEEQLLESAEKQDAKWLAASDKSSHDLSDNKHLAPAPLHQLILAANQFIVKRPMPDEPGGLSIIAGYHWLNDFGRDILIALPGLSLATGRPQVAAKILRTFTHFIDQGMVPNRFPDYGEGPEYNAADTTLWYVEAIRAYYAATGDKKLVHDLFPALQDIIAWHQRGTRHNIHADPEDGLLYAGEEGRPITWMNARIDDRPVTPRTGKPVEVNALWYNALRIMADFAELFRQNTNVYETAAAKAREGFGRFWHEEGSYCYDVIDTPEGNDASLRPNQIFAVSLPHSPLTPAQQKGVVNACAHHLLTSHGLRSLAPDHPAYIGSYGGDTRQRRIASHQGTVWAWLMGSFVRAYLRVYNDPDKARSFLKPLFHCLADYGVGSIGSVFDGNPPFLPNGSIAQAWSVAETLRAYEATGGHHFR